MRNGDITSNFIAESPEAETPVLLLAGLGGGGSTQWKAVVEEGARLVALTLEV